MDGLAVEPIELDEWQASVRSIRRLQGERGLARRGQRGGDSSRPSIQLSLKAGELLEIPEIPAGPDGRIELDGGPI